MSESERMQKNIIEYTVNVYDPKHVIPSDDKNLRFACSECGAQGTISEFYMEQILHCRCPHCHIPMKWHFTKNSTHF
jgi:Zn finger protein HypA/HybF involved in hydrogenase expression